MKKRILLIGDGFKKPTEYLQQHGYDYVLLRDILRTKYPNKAVPHQVLCDFSSAGNMLATISRLPRIDAILTPVYEPYIVPAAQIAEHLELPGLPVVAATACTDKLIMRQHFAAAPKKISPDFALVSSEADLRAFAASHTFPLILKPANLAKSLLVTKSDTPEQLLQNYRRTAAQIQTVYKKYAPHAQPKILVEEFLVGRNYSIDAFVDAAGTPHLLPIVDYEIGHEVGFDDTFQYSRVLPTRLSIADQTALRECATLGITALGMANSPAHAEIIMTPHGPRIVEIGARNGGYRAQMYRWANGIDVLGGALAVALGQQPHIATTQQESYAVLELFPHQPGAFAGIAHEADLRALKSFKNTRIKVAPGALVGRAADGYKMCAIVELHHKNSDVVKNDMAYIRAHVTVATK